MLILNSKTQLLITLTPIHSSWKVNYINRNYRNYLYHICFNLISCSLYEAVKQTSSVIVQIHEQKNNRFYIR